MQSFVQFIATFQQEQQFIIILAIQSVPHALLSVHQHAQVGKVLSSEHIDRHHLDPTLGTGFALG